MVKNVCFVLVILLFLKEVLVLFLNSRNKPRTLVLSGGGILGFMYLGALATLDLSTFYSFVGVSAGAVFATFCALRILVSEMHEFMLRHAL